MPEQRTHLVAQVASVKGGHEKIKQQNKTKQKREEQRRKEKTDRTKQKMAIDRRQDKLS